MTLLKETTIQKWNSKHKKYYLDLGYTLTKIGEEFEVKIEHLPKSSKAKVQVICDKCGRERELGYDKYLKNINSNEGNYHCKTHLPEYYYNFFKENGYELLTPFKSAKGKLKSICPNGHVHMTNFNAFQYGYRCNKCYHERKGEEQRLDFIFVKSEFEKRGYKLLSKENEYKDLSTRLEFICPVGHHGKMSFASFYHSNHGCKECGNLKKGQSRKHSYSYIKEQFENRGYVLLSKEYKNANSKLKFICPKGHKGAMTFGHFNNGHGCNKCGYEEVARKLNESNNIAISRQQRYLHDIIGGKLNYNFACYHLDIAFIRNKIYIEYDGGGHDLQVKFGNLTQEEFEEKEIARQNYLSEKGWKEIRIISRKDYLPNNKDLKRFFKSSILYLKENNEHKSIILDVDNKILIKDSVENKITFTSEPQKLHYKAYQKEAI